MSGIAYVCLSDPSSLLATATTLLRLCQRITEGCIDPVMVQAIDPDTNPRRARNPSTGEVIRINASRKARSTPFKGLKHVALSADAAPRLVEASAAGATRTAPKRPVLRATWRTED